ncbi:MAG: hypothetical protein WBF71_07125 [Microthrixaceae bacterium]
MSFNRVTRLIGDGLLKVLLLGALVALSGAVLGVAVGYPIGRIKFSESNAVRLDQSRLAGTIDPANAITKQTDLPLGWEPGEPGLSAFGILGNEFCGDKVPLPGTLSNIESSVFKNGENSSLISQAVRVEQWQGAREYIRSVKRALESCNKFFQKGPDEKRIRVDIKEGDGEAPITDFVARRFVSSQGTDVQNWSIMAVGDVLVGTRYLGQSSPQRAFMSDVENEILIRIAPQTFAVGETDSEPKAAADGSQASTTASTVIEGGAADETPSLPGDETTTTAPGG